MSYGEWIDGGEGREVRGLTFDRLLVFALGICLKDGRMRYLVQKNG